MGMIKIKTSQELEAVSEASKISNAALWSVENYMVEGISTKELDDIIRKFILLAGAKPSFLNLYGFPASACISLNEQVIHGIPSSNVRLKNGDIVSIDVGAYYRGFHGDNAYTFTVGEVLPEISKLLSVTNECLYKGIEQAKPGNRVGDISNAVQLHAEGNGFAVVREFVGHGVGRDVHESPEIPNFGKAGHGPRLVEGMVIAIEPMINLSGTGVKVLSDKWTVVTTSGKPSAHFEHTVAITATGAKILTVH